MRVSRGRTVSAMISSDQQGKIKARMFGKPEKRVAERSLNENARVQNDEKIGHHSSSAHSERANSVVGACLHFHSGRALKTGGSRGRLQCHRHYLHFESKFGVQTPERLL